MRFTDAFLNACAALPPTAFAASPSSPAPTLPLSITPSPPIRPLDDRYFAKIAPNIRCIYLSDAYDAAAILGKGKPR
jgi:hypothetical protein